MANLRISQLTPGNPAQSGDVIPIERSDVNFSITAGSIAALATAVVSSVFGRTGAVTAQSGDYSVAQITGAAPAANPTFTGTAIAPTPSSLDNSTKIATTAYVAGATGSMNTVSVNLSSAVFLTVDNTAAHAFQVIPSPGLGNQIVITGIDVNMQFASTPYDTGTGNLGFYYSTGSALTALSSGFIANAQVKNTVSFLISNHGGIPNQNPFSLQANQALVMALSTATKFATGDSPFVITVTYKILPVA